MTTDNPNNLDIWGDPVGEKKDCFYCGLLYYENDSDAPVDYRATYCSLHCYEADMKDMKAHAKLEERLDSGAAIQPPRFRMKIRPEGE